MTFLSSASMASAVARTSASECARIRSSRVSYAWPVPYIPTFDRVAEKWTVVSSEIDVKGTVPGTDAAAFTNAAEGAKENCPISRALKGNVRLSVNATLS